MEEADERVAHCWLEFARVQFVGKCVEWQRILAKVRDVEDGFSIR